MYREKIFIITIVRLYATALLYSTHVMPLNKNTKYVYVHQRCRVLYTQESLSSGAHSSLAGSGGSSSTSSLLQHRLEV